MEDMSSNFQQKWSQAAWIFTPLCRAQITFNWTQARTISRPQGSVPQLHEGIWRIRTPGTSEIPRGEASMLLSTTLSSLQGNKYHNKDSSCVWWKCQDFQWIVTKRHITSGSYCPTGPVFHCTAVQNPSGVLHSWHSKNVSSDQCTSTRPRSTKNSLEIFIWRTHPKYKLTTVTYGTSSAPYLATRCLKKLADDNKCQYPRAAQVLSNDFYVDDLLSGTSTTEDAIKV